jgi:hypothetical protein
MHLPVWFILFASFWGFNAFVALWKQKFALCLVFFSQICIASLFATGTWPADLPSIAMAIVTGVGLLWMIVILAAALRAMGRVVTPPGEQGARSKARQSLELRGYTIRRFIFGGKHEVRSPNGQLELFDSEQDFFVWACGELQK